VSSAFPERFGLSPAGTRRFSGKVAGQIFRNKPAVVIPEIKIPECLPLKRVSAIASLQGDEWNEIIVLGLNVLNHLKYAVSREDSTFEWIESLTSDVEGSQKSKFNHLILNGKYLLFDATP
jgi:hypothetical protein